MFDAFIITTVIKFLIFVFLLNKDVNKLYQKRTFLVRVGGGSSGRGGGDSLSKPYVSFLQIVKKHALTYNLNAHYTYTKMNSNIWVKQMQQYYKIQFGFLYYDMK